MNKIYQYASAVLLIVLLTTGCDNKEDLIKDTWIIDAYYQDGIDIKSTFYGGGIKIQENDSLWLPITKASEYGTEVGTGTYRIYHKDGKDLLEFKTMNPYFNHTFTVTQLFKETTSQGSLYRMQLDYQNIQIIFSRYPNPGE